MATDTVASPSRARSAGRVGRQGATHIAVAVLGTLVGVAGVEHGIGEILQGPVAPDGWFIMSWPDAAAMPLANLLGMAREGLVIGLATFAFANFGLALWAVRARDRLQTAGS